MLFLMIVLIVAETIVIRTVDASGSDERLVFRKCCLENQSLIKNTDYNTDLDKNFICVDKESAALTYNISKFSSFVMSPSVKISFGIPDNCEKLDSIIYESRSAFHNNFCTDKLIAEVANSTLVENIPTTVSLVCDKNDHEQVSAPEIFSIPKCCTKGKRFDTQFHVCRKTDEENEKWLINLSNSSKNQINDIVESSHCKYTEYAVELSEELFALEIIGNNLKYSGTDISGSVPKGGWCIDGEFGKPGLVARVCTTDCNEFGAFCLRKCCPIGFHYKPFACDTYRSRCVRNAENDNEILFNASFYLDPLMDYVSDDKFDVMGIRINLKCEDGKFALNRSSEDDKHYLTEEGLLLGPIVVDPYNYCLEMFDYRDCPNAEIQISALTCFLDTEKKNYHLRAALNTTSAVCLVLTLLIYCSLPELRNLHGRNLISHNTAMCLAYSCLARAQYDRVEDETLCIFIGYGIYFGFVAAFVWLNVMCFDIWSTFGSVRSVQPFRKASAERRRFIWYSLYAWGLALTFTMLVLILDKFPVSRYLDANMGQGMCWFGSIQNSITDWPHYILFVIPMGLMTFANLVLWLLTARHCARVKSEVHRFQAGSVGDRVKRRFRIDRANYILTGKLWIVMGVGWFSELFSTLTYNPWWLWFSIDLVNQLQGVLIFIILVLKPKVYHLIKKRLGCSRTSIDTRLEKPDAQKNGTSSSGRTSSTFLSRTISSDERANLRISLQNGIKRA